MSPVLRHGGASFAAMGVLQKHPRFNLLLMLVLTTVFFIIEIVVGYLTNSTTLVADSFHMLSDVLALIIGYASLRICTRKWSRNTFGWARIEVLGALVNAVSLLALCFSILAESISRILEPEPLRQPMLTLVVGVAGLLVNLVGLVLLRGGDEPEQEPEQGNEQGKEQKVRSSSSMNMEGVFLHVLADALGSIIVVISASVVLYADWSYSDLVDPVLTVVSVMIIVASTVPLLLDSSRILLQTVPGDIQVGELRSRLLAVPGVSSVHELHVWQLAGQRSLASLHAQSDLTPQHWGDLGAKLKQVLHQQGIHSSTVQLEPSCRQSSCALPCPQRCQARTCCGGSDSAAKQEQPPQ